MLNNRFIQQISVEETFPFKKFLLKEFPSDKLAVCHIGSVIGGTLDGGRNTQKKESESVPGEADLYFFFVGRGAFWKKPKSPVMAAPSGSDGKDCR